MSSSSPLDVVRRPSAYLGLDRVGTCTRPAACGAGRDERERTMRGDRILWFAALAAVVALSAPAAAQANEVTKWNEIAQNTVLAQPPITSAPPAAVTFIAMVQGAVYDAVNAIDQTHRPYCSRASSISSPRRRPQRRRPHSGCSP